MKVLRNMAIGVIAAGTVFGLSACDSPFGGDKPVLGIGGGCTTKGGTLKGVGTGFDANALYKTTVTYPNGDEYPTTGYYAYGSTDENGVMTLEWPCKGDDDGKYTVRVTEVAHNDKSATARFTIDKS